MRSVQKKVYSDIGRCCNKLMFIVTCDLHRFYTNWKVVLRLQPKSSQILTMELNMLFIGTSMWGISPYGRLKRGQKWRTKFSDAACVIYWLFVYFPPPIFVYFRERWASGRLIMVYICKFNFAGEFLAMLQFFFHWSSIGMVKLG